MTTAERGRPRTFDKDLALERALSVFWRNGYQGASMSELTEVMGISKPSLYAAFGDKAALYLQCLELYAQQQFLRHRQAMEAEENPERAVHAFFASLIDMLTHPDHPGGCLVVNGATACGSASMPPQVADVLAGTIEGATALLRERLQRDAAAGRLPSQAKPDTLADYIASVMLGLAVMARSGTPRARLEAAATQALQPLHFHPQ